MTRVRRHRITDEEWEHHKPAIKRIYLDERSTLDGEHGVMNLMRSRHDFIARQAYVVVTCSVADNVLVRHNMRPDSRGGVSARTFERRTGMPLGML